MEPTVEKMNLAKWFVRDLYLRRNRSCFVERKIIGVFLPGYKEWKSDYNPEPTGLKYIDHMECRLERNEYVG
jgi:4-hydroxyphenylpyruvate dioxygenase